MANEMRDRLVELIYEARKEWDVYFNDCLLKGKPRSKTLNEFIADHLIENGVIVPPCSLHQTLWEITWNKRIEQCKVSSLTQKSDGSFKIRISPKCSGVYEITPDKIGKTVFLTKAEAEQKLKEMRGE
jgi:hypothetical protein